MMKSFFPRAAGLAAMMIPLAAGAQSTNAPSIGLCGDEPDQHTHLKFEGIAKDEKIVRVSAHLIVDKAAPKGLNFFAIQVNFPNKTWAHGGPQDNTGEEMANWGGLVNRGGGSKDYTEVNWQEDLKAIECGVAKPNTVPWKWERNREYVLTIERGNLVHLPAGTNAHFHVPVPERTMWEWNLTIKPVEPGVGTFTSQLYDAAGSFKSFYLWNESGYGSKSSEQHTRWSLPVYRTEGNPADQVPTGYKRF